MSITARNLPLLIVLALTGMPCAWSLNADQVRGGWESATDGAQQRVYDFEIQGDHVTGVYCTNCADATTLAFIEGTVQADQLRFTVKHVRDDGTTAYEDQVTARIQGDHLAVSGQAGGPGGAPFHWSMQKDPRGPASFAGAATPVLPQPGAPAANVAAYVHPRPSTRRPPPVGLLRPQPYEPPGPWEPVSPQRLVGVWFAGTGHGKQHFFFHEVDGRLLGMVCGPCDNPYTMAAIDDFHFQGDTVTFEIHHEDFGAVSLPFHNTITAHLAGNELRIISAIANNLPIKQQPLAYFAFSMIGPVSFEATAPHASH